jgi:hypothetical protein
MQKMQIHLSLNFIQIGLYMYITFLSILNSRFTICELQTSVNKKIQNLKEQSKSSGSSIGIPWWFFAKKKGFPWWGRWPPVAWSCRLETQQKRAVDTKSRGLWRRSERCGVLGEEGRRSGGGLSGAAC